MLFQNIKFGKPVVVGVLWKLDAPSGHTLANEQGSVDAGLQICVCPWRVQGDAVELCWFDWKADLRDKCSQSPCEML